jgi:hypothetical protein
VTLAVFSIWRSSPFERSGPIAIVHTLVTTGLAVLGAVSESTVHQGKGSPCGPDFHFGQIYVGWYRCRELMRR